MSRSYKRIPIKKLGRGKVGKKSASRKIRHNQKVFLILKSMNYKRYFQQWDIWDFRLYGGKRSLDNAQEWDKAYYRK